MSYDVFLKRFSAQSLSPGIFPRRLALGDAEKVRQLISSAIPDIDWSGPWGIIDRDEFSIDIFFGNEPENHFIMLHIRGRGNPAPLIAALCRAHGWNAEAYGEELGLERLSGNDWRACKWYASYGTDVLGYEETPVRGASTRQEPRKCTADRVITKVEEIFPPQQQHLVLEVVGSLDVDFPHRELVQLTCLKQSGGSVDMLLRHLDDFLSGLWDRGNLDPF